MNFSFINRTHFINLLKTDHFDVVIIGGGVTGAGALLDAQSRGLKACLVEMQDFSQGTSSRSTKLIHGGLRYLKQGDLKLVAEVGRERNNLYKNASYLTQPTEVIIPFEVGGSMNKFTAKLAMIAYEILAKVERRFKHSMLRRREVKNLLPNLNDDKLKGGVIYYEYKTNDSRLTIELIKKAVSLGAVAVNYTKAVGFEYNKGKVSGVKVMDSFTGESFTISTNHCICSTGPWTDDILKLEDQKLPNKVVLTKGVHIVFDKKRFPLSNAVYFEVGDGRMVFAIPKFDNVYVGTTDTFYDTQKEHPNITLDDVQYIIDAINNKFGRMRLTPSDVVATWSGLRPLIKEEGKGESEISRKDELFTTDSGIIAIAGGKLTGFRKMAEKVVDIVATRHAEKTSTDYKKCITSNLPLLGFEEDGLNSFVEKALEQRINKIDAEKLYHWFGKQAYDVIKEDSIGGLPPYLGKSLNYGLKYEMISNPIDFLIHRTQLAYFDLNEALSCLEIVNNHINHSLSLKNNLAVYRNHLESLQSFSTSKV